MKSLTMKRCVIAGALAVIILGCDSVLNQINSESSRGRQGSTGTGGSAVIDTSTDEITSDFSDAPISPGGTGGVVSEEGEPAGEETRSFFSAFQIDPEAEDTAGPKFVVSADINKDGLTDLVSGWNQSQPVQLHLQSRTESGGVAFRTVTIAGTTPVAVIAGVQVGQLDDDNGDGVINDDDWLDIVVLSKATGFATFCPPESAGSAPTFISNLDGAILIYFSPGADNLVADGDRWTEMKLVNPFIADVWIHDQYPGIESQSFEQIQTEPEWGGFTDLAVGNVDGVDGDDIVVALNPGVCKTLNQDPPTNTVDLWVNPGPGVARMSELWGAPPLSGQSRNVPITLMTDAPQVKDIELLDVDDDGDEDVIATWTNALSQNIRWARNPLVPHADGDPGGAVAVIDGVRDGGDFCVGGEEPGAPCASDAGCPGTPNGTCTNNVCAGGATSGAACGTDADCVGTPAGTCESFDFRYLASNWQVRPVGQIDTGADVITLGDVDADGFTDVVVRSTEGPIVQWFRHPSPAAIQPEFPPNDATPDRFNFPWQVYTITEFDDNARLNGIAVGDITGDGRIDLVAASAGAVFWYDGTSSGSIFDPWASNTIIQDSPDVPPDELEEQIADLLAGEGVGVQGVDTSTNINALLTVDLDDDGRLDIVGTLDRRSGPGLSDDRLVWYRNTRRVDEEGDTAP